MPDIGTSKDALRAIVGLAGEFVGTTDSATLTTKTINTTDNTLTATSQAAGDILKNNGTKFVRLARGSANQPLKVNSGGTDLDYGTLPVAGGGTGATTLTGILKGSGTSAFTAVAAPTGAIVGDSDTQILSNKTFSDPQFNINTGQISFTRTTAGSLAFEVGPATATPAICVWDWHISNADGDYSTRFLRNSTTTGRFDFIQNAGAGFKFQRNTDLSTVGGVTDPLMTLENVIQTTDASPQNYPTANFITYYRADDATDPFSVGSTGLQTEMQVGVSPANRAAGSALARATTVKILGSGGSVPTSNEIALDMGWMKCVAGETCSVWFTDWSAHGPVAVQPGGLWGINMFVNNYYNGSPLRAGSYGLAIQTEPNNGGGNNAEHAAVSTYKLNYGMVIAGYAGTVASPTRGYEIGLMIGGFDTAWLVSRSAASKIGTGIKLRDIESVGIDLNDPATSASSPIAIKVTTVTRTWDTFLDLSSGLAPTTAAIKLGGNPIALGTTQKIWESGTNNVDITATANTISTLRIAPNISTVSSTVSRGVLRVLNNTGANAEHITIWAKGTTGFLIDVNKDGAGTLRPMIIQMGANDCITINIDNSMNFNSRNITNLAATSAALITPAITGSGGAWTLPAGPDSFVGLSTTGTLTNKTLTSPAINTPINKFTDVTKVTGDSPYSILTTDDVIRADASSGALICTLPTAVGVTGKTYTIRRIDILASTVLVTVATTSSQTISSAPAWYLWPGEFIKVESDGANWQAISHSINSAHNYYMDKGSTNNKRYGSNVILNSAPTTSTTSPAANTLWALPIIVGKVTKFDTISFRVTTTGVCNARAGIYRDNGNCYPGALIFDTGSIDCSTGTIKDTTITAGLQVFPPGLYWLAWECSAATIQIRILGGSTTMMAISGNDLISTNPNSYGFSVAHTFGALPDPYTAGASYLLTSSSASNPVPYIGLRAI